MNFRPRNGKTHVHHLHICIYRYYVLRGRRVVQIMVLVVHEYLLDIWIIIVHFGLFLAHLHPFATSWSIVVTE